MRANLIQKAKIKINHITNNATTNKQHAGLSATDAVRMTPHGTKACEFVPMHYLTQICLKIVLWTDLG